MLKQVHSQVFVAQGVFSGNRTNLHEKDEHPETGGHVGPKYALRLG